MPSAGALTLSTGLDADLDPAPVVRRILTWYGERGRDLPWRRPNATPWQIVISEFMLQQTPVARVLGPWQTWVERWPSAPALAAAPVGEAVRAWGRLGYPRRALRLHAAATVMTERHDGEVPTAHADLLALPGVGSYTAAATASFAFSQRHIVLDTNVRRVLTRIATGIAHPPASLGTAEEQRARRFLPRSGVRAARWAVASMELGALICTARSPRCDSCPVARHCAWHRLGHPVQPGPPRRGQAYAGTDRQCRGALLAVLRSTDGSVPGSELARAWPQPDQRRLCLESLRADGLLESTGEDRYALPMSSHP
ncbi:MAG TPA: A/G-specific adenine glycosylase [Microlunatus sp.]